MAKETTSSKRDKKVIDLAQNTFTGKPKGGIITGGNPKNFIDAIAQHRFRGREQAS